jgi:lysyl-tRNA synthetase class 2
MLSAELHWRPTASLAHLQRRAQLLHQIRAYFVEQHVLEVETPVLLHTGVTDPHIDSIVVSEREADGNLAEYFLQTSPEYAMKRLLAAGSGPIYQISRVFRAGESGRRHCPEFSLLEWYRPGFDHHALMEDVETLLTRLLALESPAERLSYSAVFQDYLDIDPLRAGIPELRRCAAVNGISIEDPGDARDTWLELLFSHVIEPRLAERRARLIFVHDYPPSQAALARIDERGLAARFELYLDGIELANGYHELNDAAEQRRRFERDNHHRRLLGKPVMPVDELLLQALEYGLPDCAGVALGLDRLLMCDTGAGDLRQVMAFTPR